MYIHTKRGYLHKKILLIDLVGMRVYNINHINILNSVTACQDTSFSTNAMARKKILVMQYFFLILCALPAYEQQIELSPIKINFHKQLL